ncbi:MAG: ParA family protein [Kiloniellales bacterium]|nr:ParA family protein [Kiloniellales bacterium]
MQVVTLASRKGGAGKTTLAGHLAVEAEKAGYGPVALVDFDPQGSLSSWWNLRESATPTFANFPIGQAEEGLAALAASGIKLSIIDTPPTLSLAVARAIACADFVVMPLRPSPHDLRSVGATLDLVESMSKPFMFVLNASSRRSRLVAESRTVLSDLGPVAKTVVHARVDFAASMVDGRVVGEVTRAVQASEEIRSLWREVCAHLPEQQQITSTPSKEPQEHLGR